MSRILALFGRVSMTPPASWGVFCLRLQSQRLYLTSNHHRDVLFSCGACLRFVEILSRKLHNGDGAVYVDETMACRRVGRVE